MQDATATPGLTHSDEPQQQRFAAASRRAYITLIGAAALSGMAMHMVRSTIAADLPDMLAQHLTLPIDLQQHAIDKSLQAVGL
jgi:hypothetical protein